MTITVLQETLNTTLQHVQKAIPSKPTLPILSSILITVTKNTCTLAATDLYFGVKTSIQIQSDEEGIFAVPGKQFKEIISSLPAGKITITYTSGTLQITHGKTKSSLQCQAPDDFPSFPEITGQTLAISRETLETVEKKVAFSASLDLARPALTTIFCRFSADETKFVATDGFRLAMYQVASQDENQVASTYLIPAKALSEVLKMSSNETQKLIQIKISDELKQVLFSLGQTQVFVRLIEGEYPPFEKIIPSSFSTTMTFDVSELEENIKRSLIFARESSNIIQLTYDGEIVKISATSSSLGSYEAEIEQVTTSGPSGNIAFNARYVLEYIQTIQSGQVILQMNESLKPAQFSVPGDPSSQYIIMPFKVSGS